MPVNFTLLCPTFEMLDDSLGLILKKHVPLRSCRVPINRNGPWYNAMKSDIIAAKNIGIGQKDSTKKSNYSE